MVEKNFRDNKYRVFFYLAGLAVLILSHISYDLSFGDVVTEYGKVIWGQSDLIPQDRSMLENIWNYSKYSYLHWSSRSIINVILIIVGGMPEICWHVLDILVVLLMGYSIDSLVSVKNMAVKYLCLFGLLLTYPVITMASAGWIATTINYSWVAAAGLYLYLIIQRIRNGSPVSRGSYIMALLAALFAMNHEQVNGMLLLFLGLMLLVDLHEKKLKKAIVPFYMINLAEFIWIITCPGNRERMNTETNVLFPAYKEYSFPHKIYEGVYTVINTLLSIWGLLILTAVCAILLIYLSFRNKKPLYIKTLAFVPLLYGGIRASYELYTLLSKHYLGVFSGSVPETILDALVLVCLLVVLYSNTAGMKGRLLFFGGLLSALATKAMLGFTVNYMVSGQRTSMFLGIYLIVACLFLIEQHEDVMTVFKAKAFRAILLAADIALVFWNYFLIYKNWLF